MRRRQANHSMSAACALAAFFAAFVTIGLLIIIPAKRADLAAPWQSTIKQD